jgi:hypothetical protein
MIVILNEVKNIITSNESTIKILRLSPQNYITTQSLMERAGVKGNEHPPAWDIKDSQKKRPPTEERQPRNSHSELPVKALILRRGLA